MKAVSNFISLITTLFVTKGPNFKDLIDVVLTKIESLEAIVLNVSLDTSFHSVEIVKRTLSYE